ncbi:hypothetical protein [Streptomyces sp. NBC_00872]|uniref:hypothetical protein n=1 Tax=Streptomyces sp. NBC_00872 TaxID=2903686 RepID=UPI003864F842|nr:hypothetical protein OG214_27390 [Streptomyces sp. NBC_00872]
MTYDPKSDSENGTSDTSDPGTAAVPPARDGRRTAGTDRPVAADRPMEPRGVREPVKPLHARQPREAAREPVKPVLAPDGTGAPGGSTGAGAGDTAGRPTSTNGTSGTSGTNGTSRTRDSNGTSGSHGSHGTSATHGSHGTSGTHGTHGTGDAHGTRLLSQDESERLALRLQDALSTFVDGPRRSVEEAAGVLDEAAERLTTALAERPRSLRAQWEGGEPGAGKRTTDNVKDGAADGSDTEKLRLTLQSYREFTERLLRI